MKGSEFLKAWKKAKPLMLTDTGVSELLRKLPDDPSQAQLKLFANADKELAKHMPIRRSRPRRRHWLVCRRSRRRSATI